jgi:hypothetical protein
VAFHQREEVELAFVAVIIERAEVTPIGLEPLAGDWFPAPEGSGFGRRLGSDLAPVVPQRRIEWPPW